MEPVHGINFAPFAPRGILASASITEELYHMKDLTGANTVILCPGAVQDTPFSEEINWTGPHTLSDEELLATTRAAQNLGLRVFWKPTVNCLDGTWRARISFFEHDVPCESKWGPWFEHYTAFQTHYASLAQKAGVELVILGCEMTQTEHRETEWRTLISAVRDVYNGPLAYNCDKYGEEYVPWWDAVDVMCSSGYYPLRAIEQNLERIEKVVHRVNKPFFFAEAGCMRVTGSSLIPNDWTLQGVPNDEEQNRWYQALFTATKKHPWYYGTAIWEWPVCGLPDSPYSFKTAPALNTIASTWKSSQK